MTSSKKEALVEEIIGSFEARIRRLSVQAGALVLTEPDLLEHPILWAQWNDHRLSVANSLDLQLLEINQIYKIEGGVELSNMLATLRGMRMLLYWETLSVQEIIIATRLTYFLDLPVRE